MGSEGDTKLEHRTFNTETSALLSTSLQGRFWHPYIEELAPVWPEPQQTSYKSLGPRVSLYSSSDLRYPFLNVYNYVVPDKRCFESVSQKDF